MNTPERIQELIAKATAGNAGAQNDLGCAYHNGDGVQRDYATARLWYEKSAEQNYTLALANLAILYEYGLGVAKDEAKMYNYRLKAAELGDCGSMNKVAGFYRYGITVVDKDLTEAFKWYQKAADKGDKNAAESLALFYDYGWGCQQDYSLAVKWYRIAAEKGLRVAQNNLGAKYENGQGVTKDLEEAFSWYMKAASQGEPYAECNVGILFLEGRGVTKNYKNAYFWLKKSADHGHERAKKRLQQMVDSGYDPEKDKPIYNVDIIANNPFRILGVYSNASIRDIQANKTKINAFLSVDDNPVFPTDKIMIDTAQSASLDLDEDSQSSYVTRSEDLVNGALAAINMPADKIKYALFWFANASTLDDLALNQISDGIDTSEAQSIWDKKEDYSSLLNSGLMYLCVGDEESAVMKYTKMIHNETYRQEFIKATVGENYPTNEDELAHLFIDVLLEQFPTSDWIGIFNFAGVSAEDDNYIASKLTSTPIKVIESAIAEAKEVNSENAALNYAASKKLRDNTKSALKKLGELMDNDTPQYQMVVDKLANQILQSAINYFNNSDDDDAPFKAMELQKYAQSIAVGKMAKDRCAQNVSILQGIIDKLPPAEIRDAVKNISSTLRRYSQMAKDNLKPKSSSDSRYSSPILSMFESTPITKVVPMIESLVKDLVLIKEKLGVTSIEYKEAATNVAAVALGITIENVNNSQKTNGFTSASLNIREALGDAVKAVKYIELMEPEQRFLNERLAPNKKTLDSMASSFAVFASVDNKTFYTESEHYNSSHSKSELQAFMKKFPNGRFFQNAATKVSAIEHLECQLTNANTIEACQTLYKSRQRDDVCDGLIDDKCFSLLKNKEKDYRKYLETFSAHKKDVQNKIKTIHKWWWALGIVNLVLLGCLLVPEAIAWPIVLGVVALIVDACV